MNLDKIKKQYQDIATIYRNGDRHFVAMIRQRGLFFNSPTLGGLKRKLDNFISTKESNKNENKIPDYQEILSRPRPKLI